MARRFQIRDFPLNHPTAFQTALEQWVNNIPEGEIVDGLNAAVPDLNMTVTGFSNFRKVHEGQFTSRTKPKTTTALSNACATPGKRQQPSLGGSARLHELLKERD